MKLDPRVWRCALIVWYGVCVAMQFLCMFLAGLFYALSELAEGMQLILQKLNNRRRIELWPEQP